MNDDELHLLIRNSQPKPEFPASFQRDVWSRIAVAEKQSLAGRVANWCQAILAWVAQPAPAATAVAAMLIAGAGLGYLTSPLNDETALRAAYVASINPAAAVHAGMKE